MTLVTPFLCYFKPFEGFDFIDVLLDKNDFNKTESGFYPGFQHRYFGLSFYCLGYFASKIDMLTCQSVQAHYDTNQLSLISNRLILIGLIFLNILILGE